jgi:hypothetical protein
VVDEGREAWPEPGWGPSWAARLDEIHSKKTASADAGS